MIEPKRLAAITAVYTGILVGEFSNMHEYIEEVLKRPVYTHELALHETTEEIRKASKQDFIDAWQEFLSE